MQFHFILFFSLINKIYNARIPRIKRSRLTRTFNFKLYYPLECYDNNISVQSNEKPETMVIRKLREYICNFESNIKTTNNKEEIKNLKDNTRVLFKSIYCALYNLKGHFTIMKYKTLTNKLYSCQKIFNECILKYERGELKTEINIFNLKKQQHTINNQHNRSFIWNFDVNQIAIKEIQSDMMLFDATFDMMIKKYEKEFKIAKESTRFDFNSIINHAIFLHTEIDNLCMEIKKLNNNTDIYGHNISFTQ